MRLFKLTLWKLLLGAFLLIVALIGVEVARLHGRANKVFEQQAPEVEAGFGQLRSSTVFRPPLLEPAVPGDAWEPYSRALQETDEIIQRGILSDPLMDPLDGPALDRVSEALREALHRERITLPCPNPHRLLRWADQIADHLGTRATSLHEMGRDSEALDTLSLALGMLADLRRTANGDLALRLLQSEMGSLASARAILASHPLSSDALARAGRLLEHLRTFRPSIHDWMRVEGLLRRQAILDSEANDPRYRVIEQRPSWKHLFSPRIARATGLNALKQAFMELDGLRRRPVIEWIPTAETITGDPRFDCLDSEWRLSIRSLRFQYGWEVRCLIDLSLLRAAIAVARFEAEKGKLAATLEALVPEYVESIPLCGGTGLPLGYDPHAGRIWSPAFPGEAWEVHHR